MRNHEITTTIPFKPFDLIKLVALMFGAIYYDQKLDKFGIMNINGALFVSVINLSFMNLYPIMTIFSTGETEKVYCYREL